MKAVTFSSRTIFRASAFALATPSLVCIGYGLSVKPTDRIICEKPVVDLGTVLTDSSQQAVFRVVNSGRGPVKVRRISTSCGCTEARVSSDTIPGRGGELRVLITFKPGNRLGER